MCAPGEVEVAALEGRGPGGGANFRRKRKEFRKDGC